MVCIGFHQSTYAYVKKILREAAGTFKELEEYEPHLCALLNDKLKQKSCRGTGEGTVEVIT